jgi:hypothetical protein
LKDSAIFKLNGYLLEEMKVLFSILLFVALLCSVTAKEPEQILGPVVEKPDVEVELPNGGKISFGGTHMKGYVKVDRPNTEPRPRPPPRKKNCIISPTLQSYLANLTSDDPIQVYLSLMTPQSPLNIGEVFLSLLEDCSVLIKYVEGKSARTTTKGS